MILRKEGKILDYVHINNIFLIIDNYKKKKKWKLSTFISLFLLIILK